MSTSLIITGTEITRGLVQDSHLKNISTMLGTVGEKIESAVFIPDTENISEHIKNVTKYSDIIITTGGLGPTDDDMTRFAVAEFCGLKLSQNQKAFENLKGAVGEKRCKGSNLVQALLPEGFDIIENKNGSACGFYGESRGKLFISLPGPPRELNPMLEEVREKVSHFLKVKSVKVSTWTLFAVAEAHFNDLSKKALEELGGEAEKIRVGTCFEEFRILLYVYSDDKKTVSEYIKRISAFLDDEEKTVKRIYEGDRQLFVMLSEELQKKGLTISTAESITGGLIAKCFTDIAGSSAWFKSGMVSYSDEVKQSELGVPAEIIKKHTAVSEECAKSMAEGAAKKFKSDVAVSVTGYAGPAGEKVGLVFIGVKTKEKTYVFRHDFDMRSRAFIRKRAAVTAVLHVLKILEKQK